MITPDWTIIASALIFLFTLWALNRLLFQPLFRILDERKSKTTDMKNEAERTEAKRDALFQNYAEKIKAEKQRGYQQAEEARKEALAERLALINEARRESDTILADAKEQIEQEIQAVKRTLKHDVEEMARIIADRVLERM